MESQPATPQSSYKFQAYHATAPKPDQLDFARKI